MGSEGTMSDLTIAYVSCRRDNRIHWFFESLTRQFRPDEEITVIAVDHLAAEASRRVVVAEKAAGAFDGRVKFKHAAPKPNVWNGPYRLTKENWFAAASQRNTALALCETSHIAFCDDLSVLMPGWLDAAYEAVAGNYIACGSYRKVRNLEVTNGIVTHATETESGIDDRIRRVTKDVSECTGGWLYGCSMVAPLEDLLEVGGFPEYMDGLGAEDYTLGIALTNAGKHLKYDRRLLTLESEELHFVEPPMKKTDKGVSPNDKSHAALRIAQQSKYFPNYYEGGIRALREHVLAGNPFPICQIPTTDWFDNQPLSEME